MEDQDIITSINPIEISDLENYLQSELELDGTNFHLRLSFVSPNIELEYWTTIIFPGNKVGTDIVLQTLFLDIRKPKEELLQECYRFIYECL